MQGARRGLAALARPRPALGPSHQGPTPTSLAATSTPIVSAHAPTSEAITITTRSLHLSPPSRQVQDGAQPSVRLDTDPAFAELGRHFYLNKALETYAARPATRMTLRQLVFFGKTLGRDRDKILRSANYVRQELAVRIAHRIRDLQALPFVVMTNKHLEEVYNKYWRAFEVFRRMPMITNMEDNERFCATLKRLLDEHLTIIPSLTIGIVETSHHLQPAQLDKFMERMLRSRISRRVLAEQHIALSEALDDPFHFFNDVSSSSSASSSTTSKDNTGDHVGIIYTNLCVSTVVKKGLSLLRTMFARELGLSEDDEWIPHVTIDGDLDARFAYIPEHLEYIIFELLKNAMSAVMRRPMEQRDEIPIRVTIVEGPPDEDLIIRISDCGGGLPDLVTKLEAPAVAKPAPKASVSSNPTLAPLAAGGSLDGGDDIYSYDIDPPLRSDAADSVQPALATTAAAEARRSNSKGGAGRDHRISTSTDPLIDVVTSFSNVRRRLELEEALSRQSAAGAVTGGAGSKKGTKNKKGKDLNATRVGVTGDCAPTASMTGIGSLDRLEALREVGTFKGTVAEQVTPHPKTPGEPESSLRPRSESIPTSNASSGATTQSSTPSTDLPFSSSSWIPRGDDGTAAHVTRRETGLGLPMTKVYTDFFGGSLSMKNVSGGGVDVYVRLPKLGLHKEAIEDIVL